MSIMSIIFLGKSPRLSQGLSQSPLMPGYARMLCISYVLVMKMIKLDHVLHGNYGQLWSNYGHYRPLLMIMKCFNKHIIDT